MQDKLTDNKTEFEATAQENVIRLLASSFFLKDYKEWWLLPIFWYLPR